MPRLPVLLLPAVLLAGCGAASSASSPGTPEAPAVPEHKQPSRPGLDGPVLAVLERQDMQFGRHDTLTIGTDGRANLVLAHGGGGFRNATCVFSAAELRSLRRDLGRVPLGAPPRPKGEKKRKKPRYDGVIIPKPAVFTVTYRGHRDMFSEDAVPSGGAPLARHISRVLNEHEARCTVTFHRP